MQLISVVLSFRNEAQNLSTLVARLSAMFATQDVDYELLFVNDASTDSSLVALIRERERNPRVKIINLSRRFGVAEGVQAGMAAASGDAIVYMDADLQDPPEVIPQLIERWRRGADIVHTVRTRRHGEHRLKIWLTGLAYRIIHAGSAIELPLDAGDFKLLSRRAVDHLLRLRESDPYLRGLVVWLGFTQVFVPYERDARHAGSTHFPFLSKNPWKTFTLGLTSFSFLPVYACIVAAIVGTVVSLLLVVLGLALVRRGAPLAGATLLLAIGTFFWATIVGAIGGVGLYMIRIYKDVRGRPAYVVESTIGLGSSSSSRLLERGAAMAHAERTQ